MQTETIRRIIRGQTNEGHIEGAKALVLRAFGQSPREAAQIVTATARRLASEAPAVLGWWPDRPA